jgi:hypothetical protein
MTNPTRQTARHCGAKRETCALPSRPLSSFYVIEFAAVVRYIGLADSTPAGPLPQGTLTSVGLFLRIPPYGGVRINDARPFLPNDRVFSVLTICRHFLGIIAPANKWTAHFKELLAEFPDIPRRGLGLIPNWEKHPLWATP